MTHIPKSSLLKSTFDNLPIYKGFRGSYDGPFVPINEKIQPTKNEIQSSTNTPVFVDGYGNFFDIHYLPIKKKKLRLRETKHNPPNEFRISETEIYQKKQGRQKLISENGCVDLKQVKHFPDPEDFETYEEFEQASIDWYKKSQEQVGSLQLPQQVGSYLYKIKETHKNLTDEKTDSPSVTDLVTDMDDLTEIVMEEDNDNENENHDMEDIQLTADEETYTLNDEQELFLFHHLQTTKPKKTTIKKDEDESNELNENEIKNEIENETENETENEKKNQEKEKETKNKETDKETKNETKNQKENEKENLIKNYLLDYKPWDCNLIPTEPKPEFYLTLEEYERALRRWTKIVVLQSKVLPMHPRQLQEQALLKSYKKKIKRKINKKGSHDYFRGHSDWLNNLSSKVQRHRIQPLKNSIPPPPPMPDYPITCIQDWDKLDSPTQKTLKDFIQTLTKIQQINFVKNLSNQRNITGKYNTIFKNLHQIKTDHWSRFHLIRNDVTEQESKVRYPNFEKFESKKILYTIPEYDRKRPVPWKTLHRTNEYSEYEKEIENIYYSIRFTNFIQNKLFEKNTKKSKEKTFQEINDIVSNENFSIQDLVKIIYLNQSLEDFRLLFKKKNKLEIKNKLFKIIKLKNFQNILNIFKNTTNEIIHSKAAFFIKLIIQRKLGNKLIQKYIQKNKLMKLYNLNYSLYFFKKIPISIFPVMEEMKELIQMRYGSQSLIIRLRRYLYLIYYISLIKNGIQRNYGTSNSKMETLITMLNEKKTEFENKIIRVLTKKTIQITQNLFEGIANRNSEISIFFLWILIRLFNIDDEKIFSIFTREDVDFIGWLIKFSSSKFTHAKNASKVLWDFLNTRIYRSFLAKSISTKPFLFLNLLIQKNEISKNVKTLLEKNFKKSSIQKTRWFVEQNMEYFEDDQTEKENIIRSGTLSARDTEGKEKQISLIKKKNIISKPPFMSLASLEYFTWLFKQLIKNRSLIDLDKSMLFTEKFYNKYISLLESNIKTPNIKLTCYGQFFEEYVICLFQLQLISAAQIPKNTSPKKYSPSRSAQPHGESPKRRKRAGSLTLKLFKTNNPNSEVNNSGENEGSKKSKKILNKLRKTYKIDIKIDFDDIYKLFDFIRQSPEFEYEFKTKILNSIRIFLRNRSIFLQIYNDGKIFDQIKQLCFDNSNITFNNAAWRLFFECVEYHSETIPYLIEIEQLKTFLTPPNDTILITNQLFYLYKIFWLPEMEQKRSLEQQKPFRRYYEKDPLKSMRKDRRNILNYFIKKLCFTRLHTVFRMFEKQQNSQAFIRLSKLYYTILQKGTFNKLYQEFKNVEEYMIGIKYFEKLTPKLIASPIIQSPSTKGHKKKKSRFIF
ncbi:sca1 complex scaffold protein scaa [Anaeramoeba flamelloides]|uniref:Sca1 complex scaffold protein scaa n=1 Tax=Anaeramoeba flamelloides TaxID=1746091 RepID=A0ABQ8Z6T4_9EUKA|nr:sca1 complex scaffold protein scaa [Anaeramoeba flamelloides]